MGRRRLRMRVEEGGHPAKSEDCAIEASRCTKFATGVSMKPTIKVYSSQLSRPLTEANNKSF